MTPSPSTIRSILLWTLAATGLAFCLSCATDADLNDGDKEVPTDPRDPEELPGNDTAPGEDPCGDDQDCHWDARGVGMETPFIEEDVTGALFNADGAVTLDDTIEEHYVIWIPNTEAGTISRVDTQGRIEVARYRTGPAGQQLEPSRTSVRSDGGVYVANQSAETVTRFGLAPHCPGVSADTQPNTSSGPDDLLDWGDDDCMIWNSTELNGFGPITAVASQETDDGSVVWVGARDNSIWKLDAESGQMLFRTESPVRPHGFAIDESENLWIVAADEDVLGRLDISICRNHETCEVDICEDNGDDCVKERIPAPGAIDGIAIDGSQRIWLGGDLSRYDPQAPAGERWFHLVPDHRLRGIAADGDTRIYGAAGAEGLYRFRADDPENFTYVAGTRDRSVTAVDIDHHGFAWAINADHNDAFVVDPGPGLFDGFVDDQVAGFDGPDAYSDMTGAHVSYRTEQRGVLRQVFEECDPVRHPETTWQTLRFDVATDGDSQLQWRVRAGSSRTDLANATWIDAGVTPPTSSPVDLRALLATEGQEQASFIEIEVELLPALEGEEFYVPRVDIIDVIAECHEVVL